MRYTVVHNELQGTYHVRDSISRKDVAVYGYGDRTGSKTPEAHAHAMAEACEERSQRYKGSPLADDRFAEAMAATGCHPNAFHEELGTGGAMIRARHRVFYYMHKIGLSAREIRRITGWCPAYALGHICEQDRAAVDSLRKRSTA